MRIFKKITQFNFIKVSKLTIWISVIFIIMGIFSLFYKGIDLSIDFTGGTIIKLKIEEQKKIDLSDMRIQANNVFESNINIVEMNSQNSNNGLILTMNFLTQEKEALLNNFLDKYFNNSYKIDQIESIGPKLGNELRRNARNAILVSLLLIGIYITLRFDRFYAVGSIIALLHDIFIILCIFSLFNFEISIAIIASFLTIVGYSLNDTIVIYDRIRENFIKYPKKEKIYIINQSLNETLSRTIITSLTTLMVVVVLYLFGGKVLQPFALSLFVGILVGTYSSLFIASPIMFLLDKKFHTTLEEE